MATASLPSTGDPEVDAGIQQANSFVNSLPNGKLKTAFQQAMTTSGIAIIVGWIKGHQYTGGDYGLAEVLYTRVAGQSSSDRWTVPNKDGLVPLAWLYMTTLFGIPIAVSTDLDTLEASDSLEGYLTGRTEQRGFVTQEQVTRAHNLRVMLQDLPILGGWSPDKGVFTLLPYVAPIPDPRIPGALFNGQMPNGQNIVNGEPVSDATAGASISIGSSSKYTIYIVIAIVIIILLIIIIS